MSSIPPNSPWRGCAAYFPQPVEQEERLGAQFLVETVYYFNTNRQIIADPLPDIVYRNSRENRDITRGLFRWDTTPPDVIFQNGFEVRRQANTCDKTFYGLENYVNNGGRPLESRRPANFAFLSTTLNNNWIPWMGNRDVYRYEIFAPGGILVAETLGNRYRFRPQDEVCFVAGIAPQYIRSVQRFTRGRRADHTITINCNFNPLRNSYLLINCPVVDYLDDTGRFPLEVCFWEPQQSHREKRQVSDDNSSPPLPTNIWQPRKGEVPTTSDDMIKWYASGVAKSESYIDAAFRSYRLNEAYLFMKNEYVRINYAPGSKGDEVLNGPLLICDGFPSLAGTAFAEYGIDCAFGSIDIAFIFSTNLCAAIEYAPGTTDDSIRMGPMTITAMFPFFKNTVFESGVDAAFESSVYPEAYLFKGNEYALINYDPDSPRLIGHRLIKDGFPSLKDTMFKNGIDAAFASHKKNEAYIFKGDKYALINFAPGTTNDYIIGGPKEILPNWLSLSSKSILPHKNYGVDVHAHRTEPPERDHDEL